VGFGCRILLLIKDFPPSVVSIPALLGRRVKQTLALENYLENLRNPKKAAAFIGARE
jgi:hypothetical protein